MEDGLAGWTNKLLPPKSWVRIWKLVKLWGAVCIKPKILAT